MQSLTRKRVVDEKQRYKQSVSQTTEKTESCMPPDTNKKGTVENWSLHTYTSICKKSAKV